MKKMLIGLMFLCLTLTIAQDQTSRIDDLDMRMALAGKSFNEARVYFYCGLAMNIAGAILIAIPDNTNPLDDQPKIPANIFIGLTLELGGFVSQCMAWYRIGAAGDILKKAGKATAESHP